MFCDLCGRQVELSARFCDLCGRQLELTATLCKNCRRELEPAARFCDLCGQKLAVEEADQQAYAPVIYQPPPPSLEFEEAPPLSHPVVAPQPPPSYEIVLRETHPVPSIPRVALFEQPPPPTRPATPPQAPPLYEIVLGEATPRPSAGAGEPPAVRESRADAMAQPGPLPQPPEARWAPIRTGRFRMTRRALAISVAGVAVIVIVALMFLGGPITLPPLVGTGTSTSTQAPSQTTATQGTGPVLQVAIRIARDPVSAGTNQVIIVTVRDPGGGTVSDASVRVEVLYPSGQSVVSEGLTDSNGQYVYAWHIAVSPENVGTFQVTVSATKSGYQLGQVQATFQAIAE